MAKQLNVNLAFNADTAKARQQIQELQKSLNDLVKHSVQNSATGDMPITKQLTEAQVAASKLQTILTQSVNVKTGNLDLTKFSQSLDQSGLKLTTLKNQLDLLGPSGQKAFVSLAQSIITADVPLARTSKLLNEMWTTMKNTVRWQLSSSILHSVMGAYQSAMGYAKDLDKSLNDIRIVTGQGVDEMARFAEQANKAAKALSTTTTEYTKASLIYYQQGLNDAEVAKRTEVTVKMANAAGQSAQVVSDQLTAVWNNFYDGSKSLEYYADVMTALGAATASSTDEIAGGLEKFAAIGQTIGLSYEYAASALATITANTRQSEDVVGTALKTIFARIQGLNLGETLDDGTSLNKYSQALEKVGISIFEQNGEIKKMDNILDEMAAKWGTLAKDQQIALAQTVAGVRQYTQLVALMDNWNAGDSDSMVANLATSRNAEGTLQEQADIYAQSWEAARDRVKAATEDLFDSIIDEEFFITILNGFEDLLSGVANFTDAINGLPGILSLLGVVMSRVFSKQITESVNNLAFTVESLTGKTKKNADELQQQALEMAKNINFDTGTEAGDREGQAMQNRLELQQQIKEISSNLTQEEQEQLVKLLEINDAYAEQAILAAKAKDAASQKTSEASAEIRRKVSRNEGKDGAASMSDYKAQYAAMQELATHGAKAAESLNKVNNALKNKKDATGFGNEIEQVALHLERVNRPQGAVNLRKLFDDFKNGTVSAEDFEVKLREIVVAEELLQDTSIAMSDGLYDVAKGSQVTQGECDALADRMIELAQATLTSDNANTAYQQSVVELKNSIAGFHGALDSFGTNVTKTMQGISSLAMAASSLKSAFDTLKNPDLSFGEKLLQVTMSLSMAIPALIAGLKALNAEQLKKNAADLKAIGVGAINLVQTGMRTAGAWGEAIANQGVTASLWQQVAAWIAVHIAALPVSVVILLIVAALAAFVAIVAGVVLAANALADAYNADAIAAEQAEKAASNLADAYNEVKQEYQDMIAAMDNYKSARDALDNLTEGTKEYETALKEANRAALELINKYGLIEGQDYNWEGDQLVIKDDAMDRVSSAKEAEMDQAYAASQMADANAKAARSKADLTEARRDIRDENGLGDGDRVWQGVVNGITAAIGIALAPATGGLSLAATALAAGAALNSDMKAAEMDAAITKAVEAAREDQNLFDTKEAMAKALNIDINDTKLVDALWANQEEIKSLAQEMNAAEAAWKLAAQNSANEILNNNEAVQNSKNADEVMAAGGKMYGTAYDAAYKTYLEDAKSRGWFNTGNADSKAAFEEYAKEAGLDQLKNFKVTNYKGDGTVEYKYIDDNGTEQTKIATAEEIAATLAAAKAAEELGASAENLVRVFNSLDASGQAFDQAMKNFLSTGDFENSTRGEATELIKQVDSNGDGTADSAEVTTYLGGKFGGDDAILSDEEAKQYGYASAQAMIDSFTKELANIDEAWDSIELPDNIVGLDDMSLKTAQSIENQISKINLGPMGEEAGKQYVEKLNEMLGELDPEDQQAALEALSKIDWSDWDAMDQAKQIMSDLGVEIDFSSGAWQKFAQEMRIAGGAIPDFSGLKQDLIEISSILGNLDFGSTINEEDYQALIAYNKEWAELFILQADGSRKFIGNSQQMLQSTRDQINAEREALAERKKVQEDFNKVKWQYTDANGNQVDVDWAKAAEDGIQDGDVATARNLLNSEGATQKALEALGYNDETLKAIVEAAEQGDENAKAQIAEMFNRMQAFKLEDLDLVDAELNEMMASTATSLTELMAMADDISAEAFDKQLSVLAQSASSLAELESIAAFGNGEIGISAEEYSQALMKLAGNFDNCTEEMERYRQALQSGNEEQIRAAESALKSSIRIGEAAEKYDLSAESLEAQSREIMIANGWGEEYAETAAQMAISNQRMNKGVEKLAKGWKDWSKILKSTETTSQDYADVLVELSDAVGDLVGWYDDLSLSSEFVSKNMKLIDKAAAGDVNAIIQLGAEVAKYEVAQSQLNTTLANGLMSDGTINALQAYANKLGEGVSAADAFASAQAGVQAGFDLIANNLDRLQNGASLQDIFGGEEGLRQWVEQLNAYAAATGMTAEQMQAMLSSVGVTANVQTDYQEQEVTVPTYREQVTNVTYRKMPYQTLGLDGQTIFTGTTTVPEYTKAQVPGPPLTTTGFVEVASISMDGIGEAPGVPAPTFTGRQAPSKSAVSSGNTGGGGGSSSTPKEPSKATKIDTTKKSEIVERYKEVNDALDDLADEYEKASRSADRLWGDHRLDALREQNELIKEQQELLAEKQRQAEKYMQQDKAALQNAAAEVGLAFSFDDKGNITNYTDQMSILYDQLAAAEAHYNSLSTGEDQDAYEETILEPLRDKIAAVEEAMEIYEESRELFEELGLEIDDLQDQIMQNNYDIIMEGLELHISFNEEDLEVIDYYLSKIEDDFYRMHEAAALMMGENGSQLSEYKQNLEEYTAAMNELNRAYAAGEITEAMYEEGMAEVRAGIMDNLSSLNELDKTMMNYYGDTIAMAQEELAKYTDQMEHHVNVLDHYQSLMSILGKETDFNALGIILEGQAKTAENALKVSKENYEMYRRQVEAIEQQIAEATTDEAKALLQKEWEAANTAMQEAQQDMLDKTEVWADALRAILENKLSGFAQDLENALTGGTSFDTLTTSMERAASLQEEYLTTTNQIYETNKLMRTAQQAIDNSTSSIAKQKLKGFINETKQLQDQTKLSQYELEIQQAKYNLLLAEMALEDARDAKTVVRLKRDNEGNLGYVYTADQDKLAEAQQELEDAQNSLYNIGLEGANEYSEKYQQTMSEMYDTFTQLQEQYLSGEFETEAEYQDAMLKAKEYYYEKLKNYSSLHQVALTTDSRVIADAWSSDYSEMIFNTEDWMRAVTEYVGNVNLAFDEWEANVETITNETLGPNLDALEDNVKDITDANDALTDSIVKDGGVIDAIESELDQVSALTGKYANLRQQIQGLIADHETLMVRIGNEPNPYTPPGTGTSGSSSSSSGSGSGNGSGSSNSGGSSSGSGQGSSTASTSSGTSTSEANAPDYSDTTKQGVALAIWNGGFGWGNGTTRRNRLDEKGFDPDEIQRIVDATNPNGNWRDRYGISDLNKYSYSSFDTGGYTGAWGSYGKFAMLHEKELVLNPGETENFLASMEVLRSIIKMIDLQSTASQLGGLLHSPGYLAPNASDTLEQNVHIEASFPEVHDRYEIEAALTSIVNRASQFANRK